MNRETILEAIPHTYRNRWLPAPERALLCACHDRREHRKAERKMMEGRK